MNTDFIFVIDQENNLTMLPFNRIGQIRIFKTEYNSFQLLWVESSDDYVLYETTKEFEIIAARDYLYKKILDK